MGKIGATLAAAGALVTACASWTARADLYDDEDLTSEPSRSTSLPSWAANRASSLDRGPRSS